MGTRQQGQDGSMSKFRSSSDAPEECSMAWRRLYSTPKFDVINIQTLRIEFIYNVPFAISNILSPER